MHGVELNDAIQFPEADPRLESQNSTVADPLFKLLPFVLAGRLVAVSDTSFWAAMIATRPC